MPLCGVYELYFTGVSSTVVAQAYTETRQACKKIERFAKIVNG